MNERCHTNSVPWMYAIGLNKSGFTESTNCVHSWYAVGVTAFIHGTVLVWPRSFMIRSWCDRGHSWYGVDVTASIHGTEFVWFRKVIPRMVPVYTVQWKFIWRIFSFLSFINDECGSYYSLCICDNKNKQGLPFTQPWPMTCKTGGNLVKRRQITKSTLRSWCNLVKWPYGVKKISIKWLLPVKVTLEVLQRHPKGFFWSCDEDPLLLHPVCYYGSNEPTLTSQFEWSVNTFKDGPEAASLYLYQIYSLWLVHFL